MTVIAKPASSYKARQKAAARARGGLPAAPADSTRDRLDDAACYRVKDRTMFADWHRRAEAIEVCKRCPVTKECLAIRGDAGGVWGGKWFKLYPDRDWRDKYLRTAPGQAPAQPYPDPYKSCPEARPRARRT